MEGGCRGAGVSVIGGPLVPDVPPWSPSPVGARGEMGLTGGRGTIGEGVRSTALASGSSLLWFISSAPEACPSIPV